jgi:hypothetical protein
MEDPFAQPVQPGDPFAEPADPFGGEPEPDAEVTVRVQGADVAVSVPANKPPAATQTAQGTHHFDLKPRSAAELSIEQALRSPSKMDFLDDPLLDAATYLENLHNITIKLDRSALEEVGMTVNDTVTAQVDGVSLRSALDYVLRDLDLTYIIQDEMLLITTLDREEIATETRVYALKGKLTSDVNMLVEYIPKVIEPQSWAEAGGEGEIVAYGPGLIILQTQRVHDQINGLIGQLQRLEETK